MKKTILFDFDGTIADTLPTIVNILNTFSSRYGYKKLTDKESNAMRDYTIKEIFQKTKVSSYVSQL